MRPPRIEKGLVLDGFTLVAPLKLGGMAQIWEVTREGDDLPVVMKIPLILDGDDPTMIVGFEMEQMILPRLSGPHVPRFVAAGDFAHQPHIVMERITGGSLYERMTGAPFAAAEVVRLGLAVARALCDLHRQGVLHLDVKPANVLFRDHGTAVMVDFGLARHRRLPDLLAEEFRLPIGTAPYMAPEQVLRARDDPRSDVFALGCVLYEMTTGRQPFGDPRGSRRLRKRLWWDPWPPRALRPDCPAWLQEIILRCLAVDPAGRYPTMAQLAFDLAHPAEVRITAAASRMKRDGRIERLGRWFRAAGAERPLPPALDDEAKAPIVLVAVDLSADYCAIADAVRGMTGRMLTLIPRARLACVNVLKLKRLGIDDTTDGEGRALHVARLIQLRAWAVPLGLPAEAISFHVLESTDPAEAIVAHARENHVDQIIMGARGQSGTRRYLGSVSAQVTAEAPCTVTVVRAAQSAAPPASHHSA
ncbi:MAG: bifunctional serine/threonine-protein kinase/universal stress protein [Phreatobacter sp.]|uniref:bifunctional serine/threonine-protein kinase/universal stress protein n=1 Tax=Phreatobacter sp. TaxID=1966341 RepID=UPI002734B0F2|nr:bifunctional serine/threonine-protein kinase/universal stress protein [Phreatobacter sp.]MDP2802007.1 bifunctional serine/threonine-protein kinase/universal stress protein [Phreatobacter sp.]